MDIDDLLDSLAQAEQNLVGKEFLAPIIGTNKVQIRVAGIICQLSVKEGLPSQFRGWGVLKAESTSSALFVRPANLSESSAYLRLFPAVKLILIQDKTSGWLAFHAHRGDKRIRIDGPVTVWLTEDGLQRFDTVVAGFDGKLFWYSGRDPSRDPALGAYLRQELIRLDDKGLPPEPSTLHKRGLSAEERSAYAFAWAADVEERTDKIEVRLRDALDHAGAQLRDYRERDDAYVVEYEVDGRSHITSVRQSDLSVVTAGICLGGRDRYFDLASLVGVLREADNRNMVWIGDDNLPEERYWQIHPPENP